MKFSDFWKFYLGLVLGFILTLTVMVLKDVFPDSFMEAAQPLAEARGVVKVETASDLTRLVNPCIVSGPLPEGCEKYVVNGVMTQPPIKIVIDTTPRNR